MKFGADISHHQKTFDAKRYKDSGENFIILKATEGRDFTSSAFAARWRDAGANKLPRAAYHFARPNTSVNDQADHFIEKVQAGGFGAGDVWALDMEVAEGKGAAHLVDWSEKWIARVRAKLGGVGLFYSSTGFITGPLGSPRDIPGDALGWIARYNKTIPGPWQGLQRPAGWPETASIWQRTNGTVGRVKQVASVGLCDYNEMTDACFQQLFHADLPALAPPFQGSTLKPGNSGPRVEQVQHNLNKFLPPDKQIKVFGKFDDDTETKLREWQKNRLIPEPSRGVVGPGTWEMLFAPRFLKNLQLNPVSKGTAVRQLKHALNQYQGNNLDTTNDTFDKPTNDVVINWQHNRSQREDGIVDMVTWYWIHAPHIPPDGVPKLH
jgi:hypothetical protein